MARSLCAWIGLTLLCKFCCPDRSDPSPVLIDLLIEPFPPRSTVGHKKGEEYFGVTEIASIKRRTRGSSVDGFALRELQPTNQNR